MRTIRKKDVSKNRELYNVFRAAKSLAAPFPT